MTRLRSEVFLGILGVLVITVAGGCATKARTGALIGGGAGALAGQAIGRSTAGTLIGAGVGTGAGYIIGNEMDKEDDRARQQSYEAQ